MSKKIPNPVNCFNLLEEKWIPVTDYGLASLTNIFSNQKLKALGGNPIQKIALTKLFLAIAQSAYTPKDDKDWANMGPMGMAKKTLEYLKKHKDCFWLYGKKPFLQIPAISKAKKQSYGAILPEIATGNTTVLQNTQIEKIFSNAERALVSVQLMGFGLGGKKTDNSIILSKKYRGKTNAKGRPSTGRPGTSIGYLGFLHTFITGKNILNTIWLNLLTEEKIKGTKIYIQGIGSPPWEKMPLGEEDEVAEKLKNSLMGRLIPISRFILLANDGIHYSEGISHPGYLEGAVDPSMTVDFSGKKPKVIWTDPEKRPWRQLTAILSFLNTESAKSFECLSLQSGLRRTRKKVRQLGIWSGGLKVSSNAGEQYVSGSNDYVESEVLFDSDWLGGGEKEWFIHFKQQMDSLDEQSRILFGRVISYFKDLKTNGSEQAKKSSGLFWQLCERHAQVLINTCNQPDKLHDLRLIFAGYIHQTYNTHCPRDTARQIDAWAKNRPDLRKYLDSKYNRGGKM